MALKYPSAKRLEKSKDMAEVTKTGINIRKQTAF